MELRIRDSSEEDPDHNARSSTIWVFDLEDTSICITKWCNMESMLMSIGESQHRALLYSSQKNYPFGKQPRVAYVLFLNAKHLTTEPKMTMSCHPWTGWLLNHRAAELGLHRSISCSRINSINHWNWVDFEDTGKFHDRNLILIALTFAASSLLYTIVYC